MIYGLCLMSELYRMFYILIVIHVWVIAIISTWEIISQAFLHQQLHNQTIFQSSSTSTLLKLKILVLLLVINLVQTRHIPQRELHKPSNSSESRLVFQISLVSLQFSGPLPDKTTPKQYVQKIPFVNLVPTKGSILGFRARDQLWDPTALELKQVDKYFQNGPMFC